MSSKRSFIRYGLAAMAVVGLSAVAATGCLDRPVVKASPRTSNVVVTQVRQTAVDKIDLLFVIDNSISMADKQVFFADAVPPLVDRLVNPICVSDDDETVTQAGPGADEECPDGFKKEFKAVDNIHIGVVTSSLGGHGADKCSMNDPAATYNSHQEDMSHLLPSVRMGLSEYNSSGFLAWDPKAKQSPPGESNAETLKASFSAYVTAADEDGCGYEATLEAWYRFLIDPAPHQSIVLDGSNAVRTGLDQAVLDQRAAFLRPDSLVAIIMLTDENDCSIVDGGVGWLTGQSGGNFRMWSGTSTCETDPNSKCCRSCGLKEANGPPADCMPVAADPSCAGGGKLALNADAPNLRCWDQKRRFGWDLLYPTKRYVDGLTQLVLPNPDTSPEAEPTIPNPLYAVPTEGGVSRDPALVFLAGIVGVPWQDIATEDTLTDPAHLTYMNADELDAAGRWDAILGEPSVRDPFMIEQSDPRTPGALNPITMDAIVGPDSTDPQANAINGHEYNNLTNDDLQFACTFQLPEPKDCVLAVDEKTGCDCFSSDDDAAGFGPEEYNRPLCNPSGGGDGTTSQVYAKGYPGLRLLEVLRDYGENSIVASICPKVTDGESSNPNYGYNPAVNAIIDRLKQALGGKCLNRSLSRNETTGQVDCAVIETSKGGCDCAAAGRVNPAALGAEEGQAARDRIAKIAPAVQAQLRDLGNCTTDEECAEYCMCEVAATTGDQEESCLNDDPPNANVAGYCYVDPFNPDPAKRIGNEALVAQCAPTERRLLRFVGDDLPKSGAITFIACLGAAFSTAPPDDGM